MRLCFLDFANRDTFSMLLSSFTIGELIFYPLLTTIGEFYCNSIQDFKKATLEFFGFLSKRIDADNNKSQMEAQMLHQLIEKNHETFENFVIYKL